MENHGPMDPMDQDQDQGLNPISQEPDPMDQGSDLINTENEASADTGDSESSESIPNSPDPLAPFPQTPIFLRNRTSSTVPQKRTNTSPGQQRRPVAPGNFVFSAHRASQPKPTISTVTEGIQLARNALVQAANISTSNEQQTQLLDLIEIFRNFTETGRVKKPETAILASQISRLETVSKTVTKALNSQAKSIQKPSLQTQTNGPLLQTASQQAHTASPASYAAAAAKDIPKTTEWTTVPSRKKAPISITPKNSLSSRQLVLVQGNPSSTDSLILRNKINNAFANKGVTSPVVVSASRSKKENIVLTTTPTFNAKYLLENIDIWKHIVQFQEALPITPWHKVAIHGIPTSLESLDIIKSEISTFNNGLQIVGQPYWLSHESNRREKVAGSVCVAFASQKDADYAIRNRLYLLGLSLRAEKQHSTPPSTQCQRCQRFGHAEARCRNLPACKICSEAHQTQQHKCNTCNAKGKACIHTVRKCVNCKEPHTADNKECETYLATKDPRGQDHLNEPNYMEC